MGNITKIIELLPAIKAFLQSENLILVITGAFALISGIILIFKKIIK